MAINYNAGFLPQQLYQNIFNAQRAGLEERNRRERERFQNLGNIAGNFIRYNQNKGDQQLKDFEERYKTQRSELAGLRDKHDPRATKFKEIQDQINLLDQDYANMKQEFNQTGFLNMGRDQSVLDLPDRTGPFAKKLINPRTGVPFIGEPGKAFDDEPIGYFQPASVDPEGTKEAYALRDKQALEGFLQENRLALQDDAQAYGTGERLGRQEFQTGEREAGQEYGTSERLGKQEFQTGERLGGENFRDSQREKTQAFQKNERLGRQGFLTSEREAGQEYGTSERLGRQEFLTGEREAGQEFKKNERLGRQGFLTSEREDSQQFKLDYLRESVGLDTGKALAVLNLQNEIKKEQLRLADKLKTASPAEIERNRKDKYREAMFKLLEQMTPEGGFIDELERQNAFGAAREMADEIYGPIGGGASMPSYGDLRENLNESSSSPPRTTGLLPSTVKPVTGEQVDQGLQVAETFPDAEGAKEIQGMASDYNATLMQFASEQDPERKNALGEKLATLETQMGPVLNNLLSTNRDKLAALKQNARDKVAGKNQEEPSFLEKIGLTKPMDQAVQEVSAGTTTVKRQEQKKNKQAYSELTPEEQIAFNESLKTANNRMDSIQGIINNFRQFNPVMYGSGVRDNFVALRDALAEISEGFGKGEFNAAELGNPNSKLTKIYLERVVPNYNVLKEKLDEKILKEQDMAN